MDIFLLLNKQSRAYGKQHTPMMYQANGDYIVPLPKRIHTIASSSSLPTPCCAINGK